MTKSQTAPEGESATTPVEAVDFASIVYSWTPEERAAREKAFVRKIDFRMIPILVSIDPSPAPPREENGLTRHG